MAAPSPLLPNPVVVPCIHLQLEVLRRPLDSAQYTSVIYSERLGAHGIAPSVGTVGDSFDNAMAESAIGLYKTELIRRRGPWRSPDQVEFSTLEYIDWFNNRRLHSEIGYVPPAEFEANHWAREPSIAPGSATTAAPKTPLRRSEGLTFKPLAPFGGSGARAVRSDDLKEVADSRVIDEIQAPESL